MDTPPNQPEPASDLPAPAEHPDASFSGKPGPMRYAGWVVALLLVGVAWAGAFALRAKPVHLDGWSPGLEAGMKVAEETDRPMLVMFTADWCGPCQTLKKEVVNTPQVQQAIADGFVPVVIDLSDKTSNNPNASASQRYGVRGIPTLLLIDASGDPLPGTLAYPFDARVTGPYPYARTPEGMVNWLNSAGQAASR